MVVVRPDLNGGRSAGRKDRKHQRQRHSGVNLAVTGLSDHTAKASQTFDFAAGGMPFRGAGRTSSQANLSPFLKTLPAAAAASCTKATIWRSHAHAHTP